MKCAYCLGSGRLRLIDRLGSGPCPHCEAPEPASRLADSFAAGVDRPVRYRRGEGVNVWASKVNECAAKLEAMDLPPEAVAVLRELFEEFGQQTRDMAAL